MAFESLAGKLGVALHLLCSFIVFMFLVTSAPVSQYRGRGSVGRNGEPGRAAKTSCLTAWGIKFECTGNKYDLTPNNDLQGCSKAKALFQATEAFYIISVVVSLLACVLAGLYFIGIKTKIPLIVIGVLECIFSLIPWALMTAIWYQDYCGGSTATLDATGYVNAIPWGKTLRDNFQTSAAYGLTVAAFCVQVIGVILLVAVTK